jgi:hypothetical protein
VAAQAVEDGVARRKLTRDEVRGIADEDIRESQEMIQHLMSDYPRRRFASSAESRGRVTVKHDPDPSALSTVISPW